jgi:hypothetical protein
MAEVMQPGVSLAVIAALQLVVLALVQAAISARKEKRDYARQDLVALRVEKVARLAEEADRRTQAKLKEIHILVNSDMTAARTAERDAMKLLVVALKQVVTANAKLEIPSPKELIDEIARAEGRILELNDILADRHAAQVRVEHEAAKPR